MNENESRTKIFVRGTGAVSPAGWGTKPLLDAIAAGVPLSIKEIPRPGTTTSLRVRQVPPPTPRPPWLTHARLRRTSPITQYAVSAALEALGDDTANVTNGSLKLGVIVCVMSGCVNYSRRFYDETLRDPTTASPLVFPETVFNAPSSHIAALLGTAAINYTLVGDPGTFLQGLALAADWLLRGEVNGCLVIGAEELDWLTSHAFRLFHRNIVLSDGAGAVYLKAVEGRESKVESKTLPGPQPSTLNPQPILAAVTDSQLFTPSQPRATAVRRVREQLSFNGAETVLVDGLQNLPRYDEAEALAWHDWPAWRISPKKILGEGLMAAAAWQTVLAIHALEKHSSALVSVVGTNQQAIGAAFQPV
jgi:3-oxoacyl-(acyl-carrier-protein) synthase